MRVMVLNYLKASFTKVKKALTKTRNFLGDKLKDLFKGTFDESKLEQLEEILYEADLGVKLAQQLTEKLKDFMRGKPNLSQEEAFAFLKGELLKLIDLPPQQEPTSPCVILIVGVNGNGKTTSTAKLGYKYKEAGKNCLFGAADTFRAAAQEQLKLWADKINIPIVLGQMKSDPSAVVFDTLSAGKSRGSDIIIIDTAGRLHTKTPLMQELDKIRRTCQKVMPGSPHETYLVLDATVGQNAIDQAKTFKDHTPLTGLILTKLDGSAKGGIIFQIYNELKIPVRFIGVGEAVQDLEPFDPRSFVDSIFD